MDYPALLAVLQQHANPERTVPMQAYMKHRFAYFGIGKPELARLCRPFFKGSAKQPVDWDFVRRCWDDPNRELQYAALEYLKKMGYTDLMVDGAPSPHQSDTTLRWLIDRLRS